MYPRNISQLQETGLRNFSSRRASRPACVPNRLQLGLHDFKDDDDDDDDDKADDDGDDDDKTKTMPTTNRRNLARPRMGYV